MLTHRQQVSHTLEPKASFSLRDRLLTHLSLPSPSIIAGYIPIRGEINPIPTLEAFLAMGHTACLPVVTAPQTPLLFRSWAPGEPLERGTFHTQVPLPSVQECKPDVLLVPLATFDRTGQRLGYGGGFYDRTLEALRSTKSILAIGIAYSFQEIATVPTEPTDQPLDWICTNTDLIRFV